MAKQAFRAQPRMSLWPGQSADGPLGREHGMNRPQRELLVHGFVSGLLVSYSHPNDPTMAGMTIPGSPMRLILPKHKASKDKSGFKPRPVWLQSLCTLCCDTYSMSYGSSELFQFPRTTFLGIGKGIHSKRGETVHSTSRGLENQAHQGPAPSFAGSESSRHTE